MLKYLLLFVFFIHGVVFAATPLNELSSLLQRTKSMSANFEQVTKNGATGPLEKASGQIYLQRPNKFRWYTAKPTQQYLISGGRYLWVYDVPLAQVTKQRIAKNNGASPAALLSGSVNSIKKSYIVKRLKGKGLWFRLIPRNKQDMFTWLEIHFNKNSAIDRMNVKDNIGQQSWFRFSKIKVNIPLKSSTFHFTPPHGVDVIEN